MAEGAFWNNWKNQALPVSGSTVSSQNASGAYSGWSGGATNNVAVDPYVSDVLSMSNKDRLAVSQMLKSAGYLDYTTTKYNKALGDAYTRAAMDWATEAARTGRTDLTLKAFLQENAIPTPTGRENIPSRQVYQYAPEQLASKIDETAQSLLGRAITEADKSAQWYKDLNKALNSMVMQGTVTTSQKVKNPKTGKMENVTIQKPEVTAEAIGQKITGALRSADPESVKRNQDLETEKWFLSMRGKTNG